MDDNGVADFEPDFSADKPVDNARRGTFVGTANFLAPEMIKDSESSCATDLWALGCVIFKMYVGKVCFSGNSEMAVFPLILSRDIEWPDKEKMKFDKTCRDLIENLL
jgi:3-phosphoinositide dependent protein kinase-1